MRFDLLSFVGGLGTGGMAQWQREKEQERQDRLDTMRAEEHGLRMKQMQGQVDDADQERSDRKSVREAGTEVKGQDGVAAGTNFYAAGNEAQAQDQAEQDAFINGTDTAAAPTKATGLTGGGKPRIGAAGIKVADMNTPDARYERIAQAYDRINPEKALEFRSKSSEFKVKQEALMRDASFNAAAKHVGNKDFAGLGKTWYGAYNDGQDAEFVSDGKDGGKYVFTKEGQKVGEFSFKNGDELIQAIRDRYYPDERRARLQAEATKRTDEDSKPVNVPYGGALVRNGKVVYKNDRLPGAGLGADGKPLPAALNFEAGFEPKVWQEEALKQLAKKAEMGEQMTADQQQAFVNEMVSKGRRQYVADRQREYGDRAFATDAARANTPEEVAALRDKWSKLGLPDSRMGQLDPRFKPAKPKAADGAPEKGSATPAVRSPLADLNDRTLQELANINGHTNQQAAKEELARRRATAAEPHVGTDAASSLAFGA